MWRINERRAREVFFKGEHLRINGLRESSSLHGNKYLFKNNIPDYPKPEFHVSEVCHVTTKKGLDGIMLSSGFKAGRGDFTWWGLHITKKDIETASKQFLEKESLHAESTEFLSEFTTSPVFLEGSRYGNFRFTFPLENLLKMYQEQFCEGKKPVLRVHETVVYSQEIMYTVVVHSPDVKEFDMYPLLPDVDDEALCVHKNGHIVWKAEAICETHWKKMIINNDKKVETIELGYDYQFFMWDHVTLALYLPDNQTLKVEERVLKEKLSPCETIDPFLHDVKERLTLEEAKNVVAEHQSH